VLGPPVASMSRAGVPAVRTADLDRGRSVDARRLGRAYFAVQVIAGAAWWLSVALSPVVRELTLGALDPVAVAIADIPLFVVGSALAAAGIRPAAVLATGWTVLVAAGIAVYATVSTLAGWGALIMAAAAGASLIALALVLLGRVPTDWIIAGPFAFRVAPARRPVAHLAVTLAQMIVFWGVFLGLVPLVIAWIEARWGLRIGAPAPDPGVAPGWDASGALVAAGSGVRQLVALVGAVVLVLASALGVWSAVSMSLAGSGTPLPSSAAAKLVITGPYRRVRNPMAVAGIVQGVAVGLVLGSWLVVAYALVGSVIWNAAVRPHEEADLEARFGDGFREYRARVRCWVPGRGTGSSGIRRSVR
jgi:protein-S-isoprenylcysteine O-methyltransferase Ste14